MHLAWRPVSFYSAPDRGAEYCDERVCLSVCVLSVREHIFTTTRPISAEFFMHVTCGRGSVLLWRRSDTLCTSGFVDDVIFAHKPVIGLSLTRTCDRHRQTRGHSIYTALAQRRAVKTSDNLLTAAYVARMMPTGSETVPKVIINNTIS